MNRLIAAPASQKTFCLYSQGLSLKMLSTDARRFDLHLINFKEWFTNSNYPGKVIDEQLCDKFLTNRFVVRIEKIIYNFVGKLFNDCSHVYGHL